MYIFDDVKETIEEVTTQKSKECIYFHFTKISEDDAVQMMMMKQIVMCLMFDYFDYLIDVENALVDYFSIHHDVSY